MTAHEEEVAGKHYFVLGKVDQRIALRVGRSRVNKLHFLIPDLQVETLGERPCGRRVNHFVPIKVLGHHIVQKPGVRRQMI
jgi:hypothetical protein